MKKLKTGLIAGALACTFALSTPLFVGCGDDDKNNSNNTEQQQISYNTISGKFVLAMAETMGLKISNTTIPTSADYVLLRAQRYAKKMFIVLDKNSIKLGEVYEVEVDHKSTRPENATYRTTDTYRIKLEKKNDDYLISCTQVGTLDTSRSANEQAEVTEILNTVAISYKNGVISKISDSEYQNETTAFIKTTTIATDETYSFDSVDMTSAQKTEYNALLTAMKGNVAADHKISIED